MNRKALIVLSLAAIFGLLTAVLVHRTLRAGSSAPTGQKTKKVVVAAVKLGLGTQIKAEQLSVAEWPESLLPRGTFTEVEKLVGRVFLFLDLGRALARLWAKDADRWAARAMLLFAALALVYTPIRAYTDTRQIRVREQVIASEKLPAEIAELRIVHLSDLQLDARTDASLVRRYIERANALQPDLAFFTGDTVTSGTEYIEAAAAWLGAVRARYGIYACLGDHDYWADPRRVPESLSRHGVVLLDDASRSLELGPISLHIAGVTNIYRRRPSSETLARLAAEKPAGHFSILIAHQPSPSLVQWAKEQEYDLLLAGHTHGGQIALPFFGLRLALARLETPFVSGAYDVGTLWVNVTNGLGLTFAPLRFHAPAEIVLLRIVPMRTTGMR